MKQDIELLLTT